MNIKEELILLAKEFNVKIKFNFFGDCYDIQTSEIIIDLNIKRTRSEILSAFFHEVSHHLCKINKIYFKYHDDNWADKKIIDDYCYKMCLKVERFVDKKGSLLMKEYYPKLRYKQSYQNKEEVKLLKLYFKR